MSYWEREKLQVLVVSVAGKFEFYGGLFAAAPARGDWQDGT